MIYNKFYNGIELPDSLSREELYSYFEKMKSGDTNAREIIIEHNIKIVFQQVNKFFYNTFHEMEELISVGTIGLIKSVDTFDISKNFQFSTYAAKCIENEIFMFLRRGENIRMKVVLRAY